MHKIHTHFDYLIVGQGLAGSLLAFELLEAGQKIMVVDAGHHDAASSVAAGIINPITGKRFVKSWRVDEFLPLAERTYQRVGKILGVQKLFVRRHILRGLSNDEDLKHWQKRAQRSEFMGYVGSEAQARAARKSLQCPIIPTDHYALIFGAQLNMASLITAFRSYLQNKNLIIEAAYKPSDNESLTSDFRGREFDRIIFCEGASAHKNPLWKKIPFVPVKGEVLHLKIPSLNLEQILKHDLLLAPLGRGQYWLGSNYEWDPKNAFPSEEGKSKLEMQLKQMVQDYEIMDHRAAIRPATRDQRPVMGQHPEHKHCFIFNGFGTKGALQIPMMVEQFTDYLLRKKPLPQEVNIDRFN